MVEPEEDPCPNEQFLGILFRFLENPERPMDAASQVVVKRWVRKSQTGRRMLYRIRKLRKQHVGVQREDTALGTQGMQAMPHKGQIACSLRTQCAKRTSVPRKRKKRRTAKLPG
jgi:hypothetical protein